MSRELYALCEQILLEIETIQNRLNFAKILATELDDADVLQELERTQADLIAARERLLQKMREGRDQE